jgi:flagellar hook-length control protein FliK
MPSVQPQPINPLDSAPTTRSLARPGAAAAAAVVPTTGASFLESLATAIGPVFTDGAADVTAATPGPRTLTPVLPNQPTVGAPALTAEPGLATTTGTARPHGSTRSAEKGADLAAASDDVTLAVPDNACIGIQMLPVPADGPVMPMDPPKSGKAPAAINALPARKAAALPPIAAPDKAQAAELAVTPPAAERLVIERDPPAVVPMPPAAIPAGPALAGLIAAPPGPVVTRASSLAPAEAAPPKAASVVPQIAPALVSLAGGPPGIQRLTLRLDPMELGHVQIRIDKARDGPAEVSITVERPETLALLQRDQHQLHLALDQAGIPAEGRQVSFHAAAPAEGFNPSSSQSSGSGLDAGGSGRGQPGPRGQSGQGDGTSRRDDATPIAASWLSAGLDITA